MSETKTKRLAVDPDVEARALASLVDDFIAEEVLAYGDPPEGITDAWYATRRAELLESVIVGLGSKVAAMVLETPADCGSVLEYVTELRGTTRP
jgi:hypothetical protein